MSRLSGAHGTSEVDVRGQFKEEKQAFADTLARSGNKLRDSLEYERQDVISHIRKVAGAFRESIAAQEMELCCCVNEAFESERRKREKETVRISQRVMDIIQNVEGVLSMSDPGEVAPGDKASLLAQMTSIRDLKDQLERKEIPDFSDKPVKFHPEEDLTGVSLGRVDYLGDREVTKAKDSSPDLITSPLDRTVRYSKHGKFIGELQLPNVLRRNFNPWAVSVSVRGMIGVVDRGNGNAILFDKNGQFVRLIEHPRNNSTTFENEIYGLTFLPDESIVIAYYNSSRSSGSMELFDHSTGKHIRCLAQLSRPAYVTSGARNSLTVVYCLGSENCPPVEFFKYDGSPRAAPKIPQESLAHPHKAVAHRDAVFVASSDPRKNVTMVTVYDHSGCLVTTLETAQLWKVSGIGHPLRIALDPISESLFVYHHLSKEVNVYSCCSLDLRAQIQLPRGIVDLSATPANQLVASFGKCCDSPNTVKIFSLCD